jgi:hypothetical protein
MFLYIAKHGNMNIVRYIETIQMLPIWAIENAPFFHLMKY